MLLVVLIWGANFSIVKAAFTQIPPLAFTALRFTIASVLLWLILYWREGGGKRATQGVPEEKEQSAASPAGSVSFWKLVGLGIIGNTLYQAFFVTGLSLTTAANTALLLATTPAMIALLGAPLGLERITRNVVYGILLALVGITLVTAARGVTVSWGTFGGDLLVLLAVVCWSIYTLGVRELGGGSSMSTLRITTLTMLTGTPGLLILGIPEVLATNWRQVEAAAWGGLLYSAIFALVVAYIFWNNSVRLVGGSRTAVYACLTPLVAALVAWPLLGERPVPLQGIGALLIIGGVLLTKRQSAS